MESDIMLTIIALQELGELGYREAWIGAVPNPHWTRHGHEGCVIAAPKRRKGGWPALWGAVTFGRQSCGNGFGKADQGFKEHARKMAPGHYRILRGKWKRVD